MDSIVYDTEVSEIYQLRCTAIQQVKMHISMITSILFTILFIWSFLQVLLIFFSPHDLLFSCLFLVAPKASVRAGTVIDKLPPSSWRGERNCF